MGQGHSIHTVAPAKVSWLIDRLEHHAVSAAQLATLTYEKFLESVTELNKITEEFSQEGGNKLLFFVKSGTDESILWKATVRIRCIKTHAGNDTIESSRILNLKQFVRLYNEILHQAHQSSMNEVSKMSASQILTEVDQFDDLEKTAVDECCICMDRKADNILPCAHSYCEVCIHEWNVSHRTCPVCRAETACDKDSWLLAEKPDDLEIRSELPARVLGLVDKAGRPIYSPPPPLEPRVPDSPFFF